MECVILVRVDNGDVIWIGDENSITTFENLDAAVAFIEGNPVCQAFPHQIVELDEL